MFNSTRIGCALIPALQEVSFCNMAVVASSAGRAQDQCRQPVEDVFIHRRGR